MEKETRQMGELERMINDYVVKAMSENAYELAEKFLIRAYGSDNAEYVAIAMTAIANKDDWRIIKMLESFIKFENDIINALKDE